MNKHDARCDEKATAYVIRHSKLLGRAWLGAQPTKTDDELAFVLFDERSHPHLRQWSAELWALSRRTPGGVPGLSEISEDETTAVCLPSDLAGMLVGFDQEWIHQFARVPPPGLSRLVIFFDSAAGISWFRPHGAVPNEKSVLQ